MLYPLKKLGALSVVLLAGFLMAGASNMNKNLETATTSPAVNVPVELNEEEKAVAIYEEMNLEAAGLDEEVFTKAMKGFAKLAVKGHFKNDDLLTIVDFSQPSNQRRLYVIDIDQREILFHTLVAHGKNTGSKWATNFSNRAESYMSSPGFYSTAETYMGSNGFSMRLDGLEGSNSNARTRAIVMHGAPYVNENFINQRGFIGRSWGCPAVPMKEHRQIINTIKDGSCLFIYAPDKKYLASSRVLNS